MATRTETYEKLSFSYEQVFDSSRMKQQKVNSCFNARRHLERVFDASDVQAPPGAEKRGEIQPGGGRGSDDVRVVEALSREAPGVRRRVADASRGKPGFIGRGEVRGDAKDRRNDSFWQEEREVAKDKIHVNGIPPEVGERELGDFFSAFGRYGYLFLSLDICEETLSTFPPCQLLYRVFFFNWSKMAKSLRKK